MCPGLWLATAAFSRPCSLCPGLWLATMTVSVPGSSCVQASDWLQCLSLSRGSLCVLFSLSSVLPCFTASDWLPILGSLCVPVTRPLIGFSGCPVSRPLIGYTAVVPVLQGSKFAADFSRRNEPRRTKFPKFIKGTNWWGVGCLSGHSFPFLSYSIGRGRCRRSQDRRAKHSWVELFGDVRNEQGGRRLWIIRHRLLLLVCPKKFTI